MELPIVFEEVLLVGEGESDAGGWRRISSVSAANGNVDLTVTVEILVSEIEGVDLLLLETCDDSVVDEARLGHRVPEIAESLVEVSHNDCEGFRGVEPLDGESDVGENS